MFGGRVGFRLGTSDGPSFTGLGGKVEGGGFDSVGKRLLRFVMLFCMSSKLICGRKSDEPLGFFGSRSIASRYIWSNEEVDEFFL
jgi:hypothetical protein